MKVVSIKNLTKYFGKFKALDGINLSLSKGEALGFLGPNGAGKTTTIRVMLGLLRSSNGSVELFGKNAWTNATEIHKNLAYVPGDVSLWPNLTGGEVIDLFCALRGKTNERLKNVLIDRFELDPTKKCSTYSKGNRQKVGLISAFASDVDLYILDEPTSGLDPLMSNVFQSVVEEFKKEGKTILMSSHILDDVEKLCDSISIIRKGKIVETNTLSNMRHLSSLRISLQTANPIVNLERIEGVMDLSLDNCYATFQTESKHLNSIMTHLIPFGVLHFESKTPTLEELFMKHYGDDFNNGGK